MKDVEVTVYCLVYNHGKYLSECLNAIVNQKTNFRFKVVVHDDASTDNSADIIREFEAKYPDIIEPIYQTENQHSKRVGIVQNFIYPRMEGKYVAICEGDDFWIDENKLQKQYDAMEENPDIHLCVCRVREVDKNGNSLGFSKPRDPRIIGGRVPAETVVKVVAECGYQFQTSGYFYRKASYDVFNSNRDKYYVKSKIGDTQLILYFSHLGDFYFIDEELSCHRNNDSNWSTRVDSIPEEKLEMVTDVIKFYNKFDDYTGGKYRKYVKIRLDIMRRGYVHCCISNNWNDKVAGIKYWKYYDTKKELIYSLMKVYAPKLLKLIGKAD